MPTRRSFAIAAAAGTTAGGLWLMTRQPDHDAAADALRQPQDPNTFAGLVHYATLAANSHNSQPWRFRQDAGGIISIAPDLYRALPVADADNHHLYASLGCAAENLMLAAGAGGRSSALRYVDEGHGQLQVAVGGLGRPDPLFPAISDRQCSRSVYDASAVPPSERRALEDAARLDGCDVVFIEDRAQVERVLELIVAANTAQVNDPAFAKELRHWLRFNAASAIETGDGLFSASSGNPSLPTLVGKTLFGMFFKADTENQRYVQQVRSSAGLAVFVSAHDDRPHWVQAGRSYQRFALQATLLGIRHAHLNQPLEVASVRQQLQALLGLGNRRPDLVVRYGYGPLMPRSLRRPVSAVIDA